MEYERVTQINSLIQICSSFMHDTNPAVAKLAVLHVASYYEVPAKSGSLSSAIGTNCGNFST